MKFSLSQKKFTITLLAFPNCPDRKEFSRLVKRFSSYGFRY